MDEVENELPRRGFDKAQLVLVKELVERELSRVSPMPAMTVRKTELEGILHTAMDLEQELLAFSGSRRGMHARTKPDDGLEAEFLRAVADELNAMGVESRVDHPGVLVFATHDRHWMTGNTGLHAHDADGFGDALPGDQHLVALEQVGGVTVGQVADTIRAIVDRQVAP